MPVVTDIVSRLERAHHALVFLDGKMAYLQGIQKQLDAKSKKVLAEVKSLRAKQALNTLSQEYYVKAIDLVYQNSVGELEGLLNKVLAYVFYDQELRIKIELDESRGSKSVFFQLLDMSYDPPMELDLRDGTGKGIRTGVSATCLMFYILNRINVDPILCIDESWSAVSEQYVSRFFSFVETLAKEKKVSIVMITHDQRFTQFGDKVYFVSGGEVTTRQVEKAEISNGD